MYAHLGRGLSRHPKGDSGSFLLNSLILCSTKAKVKADHRQSFRKKRRPNQRKNFVSPKQERGNQRVEIVCPTKDSAGRDRLKESIAREQN